MAPEYYQIGGFRPHIQWLQSTFDDKQLAEVIGGPSSPLRATDNVGSPLELILGIKRYGSSHLLLTDEQTRTIANAMRLPLPRIRGYSAREFESLSPIFFNSVEELTKKLSMLKPKAKKSKASEQPSDTSQANRGYNAHVDNLYRGTFEHCRVVHRILENSIDPRTYGVEEVSWKNSLQVSALALNVKGVDHRPVAEKVRNPAVLDVGFCDAILPAILPAYSSAKHIINVKNMNLGRTGTKKNFSYGESEKPPVGMMGQRIQDLFKDHQQVTYTPMILLVAKEEQTMNYLQNIGVDTSRWRYGLKDLLIPENSQRGNTSSSSRYHDRNDVQSNSAARRYDDSRSYSQHPRSRSRSPRRHDARYNNGNPSTSSHRFNKSGPYTQPPSVSQKPLYAPVYVVDIQQLYTKVMQTQEAKSIVDIAHRFELTEEDGWWCAGNEASLLVDIWRSMAAGAAIDEQRELRSGGLAEQQSRVATPAPDSSDAYQPHQGDSDDEEDPNDFVHSSKSVQVQKGSSAPPSDPYINFDVSDYGSESEESE